MSDPDTSSDPVLSPLVTAQMTPSSVTHGVRVDMDPLHLDELPHAMEKMNWPVSARMMRRWFATKPAYAMPSGLRGGQDVDYRQLQPSQLETSIVKMDWLLKFPRGYKICQDLLANWNNVQGVNRLRVLLARAGWMAGKSCYLGSAGANAIQIEMTSQVNRRIIGEYADTLDDLYGAVFKATLKIGVTGRAYYSSFKKRDVFEVGSVGMYLRDTYDFNLGGMTDDLIGLGIWSRDRMLSKADTLDYKSASMSRRAKVYPGFVPVKNEDFERWRQARGAGGDFFVFSDVLWQMPPQHFVDL